jgi:hypothetical protein
LREIELGTVGGGLKVDPTPPEACVRQSSNLFSPDSFSNREMPEQAPPKATASHRISLSIPIQAWYDCFVGDWRTGESRDGLAVHLFVIFMKR